MRETISVDAAAKLLAIVKTAAEERDAAEAALKDVCEEIVYLEEISSDFFAWFNRHYPDAPSTHDDHPWCRLGLALGFVRAAMSAHGGEMNSEQERELAGRMRKAGVFDAMERNGYPYKQMLEETQRQAAILVDRIAALEAEKSDMLKAMQDARRALAYAQKYDTVMEISYLKLDAAICAVKPAKEG